MHKKFISNQFKNITILKANKKKCIKKLIYSIYYIIIYKNNKKKKKLVEFNNY